MCCNCHCRRITKSNEQVIDDAGMTSNQPTMLDRDNAGCVNTWPGGGSDSSEAVAVNQPASTATTENAPAVSPADCLAVAGDHSDRGRDVDSASNTAVAGGVSSREDVPTTSKSPCTAVPPDSVADGTPLSSLDRRAALTSMLLFHLLLSNVDC